MKINSLYDRHIVARLILLTELAYSAATPFSSVISGIVNTWSEVK
jgi:hypothetical protein